MNEIFYRQNTIHSGYNKTNYDDDEATKIINILRFCFKTQIHNGEKKTILIVKKATNIMVTQSEVAHNSFQFSR